MRERVRQLGGTLKIQSNGTGTAIIATLQIDIGRQGNEQIKELLAP
jgi:signal transduction histidine kinase